MKRAIFACALALLAAGAARANLSPADLAATGVDPPREARLPSGRFIDQHGRAVALRPAPVPTLLLFADYSCAHLCGPGATLTAGALHDAGLRSPRDYRLVLIGLDADGPARANAFAARNLKAFADVRGSALLLTGAAGTVAAAERALGYHVTYDPEADQFAHDAASFLFTPRGRLSRVLPEVAVTAPMLRSAIADARAEKAVEAQSLREGFVALCYGLAAAHGRYAGAIVAGLRLTAAATLGGLALLLWRLALRRRAA